MRQKHLIVDVIIRIVFRIEADDLGNGIKLIRIKTDKIRILDQIVSGIVEAVDSYCG